jgi:hypothetical protein
MSLDLVFSQPPHAPGDPLDLVFGAVATGPVLPVTITGTITLGAISVSGVVLYDNRLPATVSASATAPHQSARPVAAQRAAPWGQPAPADSAAASPWQLATPAEASPVTPWEATTPADTQAAAPWQHAQPVSRAISALHQACTPVEFMRAIGWQDAAPVAVNLLAPHQVADVLQVLRTATAQAAAPMSARLLARHQVATPASRAQLARWQVAAQLIPPGLTVYVPPGEPEVPGREISLDLVFACPPYAPGAPLDLVFGHVCGLPPLPSAPLFILPSRYYMAVHSLTCHKLPSMEPVPIYGVTLSADEGSFGWSFRANAPLSVFEQLAATGTTPTRVLITLDGLPFEFVLDEPESTRGFGRQGATISGRSATALLANPYQRETARVNFAPSTAQQLALQALDLTGFALDWGLTDWLVPAGAWSHIGTPLAAVQAIVAAAGGHLQSARNAATLLARHPYPDLTGGIPGAPWMWADPAVVPDIELAPDALVTVNTSRVFGADVNAVYVSGTTAGFRALYKRQGTAGTKLASPITEPLGTAAEVLRQRGRAVVGAAGLKQFVTLELPVLTGPSQPGVIDPGKLLQINSAVPWRGRVRGVSVSAPFGGKVRQQLRVEQHLEVAP